jgi:hypothetical protein
MFSNLINIVIQFSVLDNVYFDLALHIKKNDYEREVINNNKIRKLGHCLNRRGRGSDRRGMMSQPTYIEPYGHYGNMGVFGNSNTNVAIW